MDRWICKVAIVTGASSGIGNAIAKDLTKAGLQVVALARRVDRLHALAAEVKNEKGELHPFQCDVSNEDDILAVFEVVNLKFGGISILINSAGVGAVDCTMHDGTTKQFKKILDTNLLALCVCTREALKSMKNHGIDNGHIININSILGHKMPRINSMGVGMYGCSKYGVTAATEALRLELLDKKSKIKVTSISPGYVQTEIMQAGGASEQILNLMESFPALNPSDISDAVLYVLGTAPHIQVQELTIAPIGEML